MLKFMLIGLVCLGAGPFLWGGGYGSGIWDGTEGALRGDTSCPGGRIKGVVRMASGNQMPAPGVKRGAGQPVKTSIYVFELTNISQVVRKGSSPYYSSVGTRLVMVVDTDSTGLFNICLPAGRYSLLTRRGDLYYASRRDADNNLAPVEVTKGTITQVECHVPGERPPVY